MAQLAIKTSRERIGYQIRPKIAVKFVSGCDFFCLPTISCYKVLLHSHYLVTQKFLVFHMTSAFQFDS